MKHGRDPRFKTIEKMKDREAIFTEFITAMRKREKEDSKSRGEKVLDVGCLKRKVYEGEKFRGKEAHSPSDFGYRTFACI